MEGFEEIFYDKRKNSFIIRESGTADAYPDKSISIFTVFSAGDYCGFLGQPGPMKNSAAYLVVGPTGAPAVHKLRPDDARMKMSKLGKNHSEVLRALEDAMKETSVDEIVHHYETVLRLKRLKELQNATTDMEIDSMDGSRETQAEEVVVTFDPGYIGARSSPDGEVLEVADGSQAEREGVQVGWKVIAVEDTKCKNFGSKVYQDAKKGDVPYRVTFRKSMKAFEEWVQEALESALTRGDENGGRTKEEILTMEAVRLIEETGEAPVKPDQLVTYTTMDYSIVHVFEALGGKPTDKQKLLLAIARRSGVQLHLPQLSSPASFSDSDEIVQKPPPRVVYLLAFRSIDKDGDGLIKEAEFREALASVQEQPGRESDVNAMAIAAFSAVTEDAGGMNVEEFISIMQGLL
jgi:hypothetical protein